MTPLGVCLFVKRYFLLLGSEVGKVKFVKTTKIVLGRYFSRFLHCPLGLHLTRPIRAKPFFSIFYERLSRTTTHSTYYLF